MNHHRRYKQLVRIQRCLVGVCEHKVTVRNIKGNYHCRVLVNGVVNQEAVCYARRDIGHTCRNLLRWEDKCGNISKFASAARERLNKEYV
jgi:hypothetical protein